jgi:hypothetical protein
MNQQPMTISDLAAMGGRARAAALTPARRSEIARRAAAASAAVRRKKSGKKRKAKDCACRQADAR